MLNATRRSLLRPPSPRGLVFFLLLTPTNPSPPKSLSHSHSHSQTLTFLIDSCGLSPESAIVASRKLRFKSTENPSAVIRLLRDYGLGETDVSRVVSRHPAVLSSDPHRNLKPKLEFFRGFGFSGESLVRILTSHPQLLRRSLENHIVPCFTFLRTLLPVGDILLVFIRSPHSLNADLNKSILPILAVLREHNLPDDRISKLLKMQPGILLFPLRRVNEIVEEVKAAGIPTSNPIFIYAFQTIAGLKRVNWDRKMAVYKSFGLSEADIVSSFQRHPMIMKISEEKIRRGLEFFLNGLMLIPDDIARHPILLQFSLEKRILPRCAVMSVLKRKGKLKEDSSVIPALLATTSSFLERYVARYQDDVPEVLEAYNGEIEFQG